MKYRDIQPHVFFRKNVDECIVYLMSYTQDSQVGFTAYVDFRTIYDWALYKKHFTGVDILSRFYNIPSQNFRGNKFSILMYDNYELFDLTHSGTILVLKGLKTKRRLIPGRYYQLNLNLLKDYQSSDMEESALFDCSYDLYSMRKPQHSREEILQSHSLLDRWEIENTNVPDDMSNFMVQNQNPLTLLVKDVGQANWNELQYGNQILVQYDAGAPVTATTAEVCNVFNSRKTAIQASHPVLVISHWDLDHIHCLKTLSKHDIQSCYRALICPAVQNSVTSQIIYGNFVSALKANNVCSILPKKCRHRNQMRWAMDFGCVSIYNGAIARNINYSGLAMFVRGTQATANLTGDLKLVQAKNVYDAERGHATLPDIHYLIAPHHGGDYGPRARVYRTPCTSILISVGTNNTYGHPSPTMLRYLRTLAPVEQTNLQGDITKHL